MRVAVNFCSLLVPQLPSGRLGYIQELPILSRSKTRLALKGQAGFDEVLDIVIIGVGISGLTSARDLQRAGCESFMVSEARDRVGGRTLNSDVGKGQVTDVGRQWIGPGQTAVANESFMPDPKSEGKGSQLVSSGGCSSCHGGQMMGMNESPRLASQGYDYLVNQIDSFAEGMRKHPTGAMNVIAKVYSKDERESIASYLANLPTTMK